MDRRAADMDMCSWRLNEDTRRGGDGEESGPEIFCLMRLRKRIESVGGW